MRKIILIFCFAILLLGCKKETVLLSKIDVLKNNNFGFASNDGFNCFIKENKIAVYSKDEKLLFEKVYDVPVSAFDLDNNSILIIGFLDGNLKEIDLKTQKESKIDKFFDSIKILTFSKNYQYILWVSKNNSVVIFDRKTRNFSMGAYQEEVYNFSFDENQKKMYIQFEKKLTILDFDKKIMLKELE
ncbi:MAG: hypothetical protein A2086_12595 [Spirochaetes bacterium GWD1_27_9]|nr:MAG: hypothetical protein A2Z98_10855 [Spirochaetes bacterium GWB1_27_13]OHD44297.1 MAG: hypothetical protein A2086_12595 [Spirochaetes bacterium GWD1_27_9]